MKEVLLEEKQWHKKRATTSVPLFDPSRRSCSNPLYGVDWKKYQDPIKEEVATLGFDGRFGAGTPRVSDGQLVFLQHMISKIRHDEVGSRIGIVMNGSPLFTGGAGSGESEIRRWMLENDWGKAIVALHTDLFYNISIQTYVWLLTNSKPKTRQGRFNSSTPPVSASGSPCASHLAQPYCRLLSPNP